MAPTPNQKGMSDFTGQGLSAGQLDPQNIATILAEFTRVYQAKLKQGGTNPQNNFVPIGPLPLDFAPQNPIALPSPIKSVYFLDATDNTVKVNLILNTDAKFAVDSGLPMTLNDSVNFGDPQVRAFLTWKAQPGKTATLYCAIDAEFRPGRMNLVQSGGVAIQEGLAPTTLSPKTVTNAATKILASDSSRNVVLIENQGGGPIYLGDSTVTVPGGLKPGITLGPGSSYEWRNAGELYGISAGADVIVALLQLK